MYFLKVPMWCRPETPPLLCDHGDQYRHGDEFRVTQLCIDTNKILLNVADLLLLILKKHTKTRKGYLLFYFTQFNIAAITYDSISWMKRERCYRFDRCASFLTNVVIFYNNNFMNYFVWKNNFLIFRKIFFVLIVLGFYRVVKTVVSIKVVMTKTLYMKL